MSLVNRVSQLAKAVGEALRITNSDALYQKKTGLHSTFDSDFAQQEGGYPKGAELISNDGKTLYVSVADNNKENFNAVDSAQNWKPFSTVVLPTGGKKGQLLSLDESGNAKWVDYTMQQKPLYGKVVLSTTPLYNDGLHLMDGSLINKADYEGFYAFLASIKDAYPSAFCTEAEWQNLRSTNIAVNKYVLNADSIRLPVTGRIVQTTSSLDSADVGLGYAAYIVVGPVVWETVVVNNVEADGAGEPGQILVKKENGIGWDYRGGYNQNAILVRGEVALTAANANSLILRTDSSGDVILPPLASVPVGTTFSFTSGTNSGPKSEIVCPDGERILVRGTPRAALPFVNDIVWRIVSYGVNWILENPSEFGGQWNLVHISRDVYYTNATDQPIIIVVQVNIKPGKANARNYVNLFIKHNGIAVLQNATAAGDDIALITHGIVPPGWQYKYNYDPNMADFASCYSMFFNVGG